MKAYVIDNGSFYTEQLEKILNQYQVILRKFDEVSLSDIEPGSFVVLSGGHTYRVQWHDKQYAKETEVIRKHDGPIIGVCLGAQLIAHVYGEHLHTMAENRKGTVSIHPTGNKPLLFADYKNIKVYENHHLSIPELHKPLISLAESSDGVEIFRHENKPIFGIQFHPEVLKNNNGEQLFETILSSLTNQHI